MGHILGYATGFASHPNSVALAPRVLRVVIDLDNVVIFVHWCKSCRLLSSILGPRLSQAATFAESCIFEFCLSATSNDACFDPLVSLCCLACMLRRYVYAATSRHSIQHNSKSLPTWGGFALPPTSLSDSFSETSETRRI